MTLEIKRTLDSVILKDIDVRNAIADYVGKHSGREVSEFGNAGIKFHPTSHHEMDDRVKRSCDTLYVTVQLKDQVPTAGESREDSSSATSTKTAVKDMIRRMGYADFKVEPRDIPTLRRVVQLIGRLSRFEQDVAQSDPDEFPGERA